jgi:hypothetical protein
MSFSSLSSYRSTAVCWWQYGKKKEGSEKKNNNSKKKTKKKKKRKKKRKIFHIPHSATRISHPIEKKKKKKKKNEPFAKVVNSLYRFETSNKSYHFFRYELAI